MSINKEPWLKIIGWGEDGIKGLSTTSQRLLFQAEVIFGSKRHVQLLPELNASIREWPVPFESGIPLLLAERGRDVVMLVSGDPFWFGAGTVLARHLAPIEWRALPAPSTFSLAAARLGWPIEDTKFLGVHAAPIGRVRPYLRRKEKIIVLVRNNDAVIELSALLCAQGFGGSTMHILEALGGERERIRTISAEQFQFDDILHPVAVALEVAGSGNAIPCSSGIDDDFFEHDGQITKKIIRAVTLSALAPNPGELLWDIGTGSGSIAIEWLLSNPKNNAIGFEFNSTRAVRARRNAKNLGVDWLRIIEGDASEMLEEAPLPDAVFVGGGVSNELLRVLWRRLKPGTRIVINAVTLESEILLVKWQEKKGGRIVKLDVSEVTSLGERRGWKASYPIVQWQVVV